MNVGDEVPGVGRQPGDKYSLFVPVPTADKKGKDLPPSVSRLLFLSANSRDHWRVKAKVASAWRHAALKAAEHELPGLRLEKTHITAFLIKPRGGRYDPANLSPVLKAIVDGIVDAAVMEDDDKTRVIGPDPRHGGVDKNRPGVWLVLEDLGRRTA